MLWQWNGTIRQSYIYDRIGKIIDIFYEPDLVLIGKYKKLNKIIYDN
ncbi:MAG: hypothetical protein F6K23_20730 [Okeania sp. SIO2C9]|nr:hypothetical protein [Okeania sp. SIO2C9]NEQ75259.1 hypothetical protein [Okeania sp. SIO2C9]